MVVHKLKTAVRVYGRYFGILLLAIAIFPSFSWADIVDRIVAEVNDQIILLSELEEALKTAPSPVISPADRETVLNRLIDEKLTLQQVTKLGISVSDGEVDATIGRIKQLNRLSDEGLQQKLTSDGMTMEAFRKSIKNQLLQSRLVNQEVESKIVITDADIKAYYDAHKQLYAGVVKYHLRHILLKTPPGIGADQRTAILGQIRALHQRLEQGEDFAELARKYSQAPTAESGGDLGLFELRLLTPEIRQALQGVEASQFSDVVETDQGYQLFLVEEIQTIGGQSLEDVSKAIEEKLYNERAKEKFQLWLADLRSKAHIRIIEQ